jgi:serine/threonine protein kinase
MFFPAFSAKIVTVFEIGEWKDRPFIATEFVEGETLAEMLTRAPLSAAEAVRWGGRSWRRWRWPHKAGIVHRDLKPANAMVRKDGGREGAGLRPGSSGATRRNARFRGRNQDDALTRVSIGSVRLRRPW